MEAHHSSSQTLRFKPLPVGLETFRVLLKRRAAYTCTIPCHHLAEKKCMVAKQPITRDRLGLRVMPVWLVLDHMQRLGVGPGMEMGLREAAPPHLILEPQDPLRVPERQ